MVFIMSNASPGMGPHLVTTKSNRSLIRRTASMISLSSSSMTSILLSCCPGRKQVSKGPQEVSRTAHLRPLERSRSLPRNSSWSVGRQACQYPRHLARLDPTTHIFGLHSTVSLIRDEVSGDTKTCLATQHLIADNQACGRVNRPGKILLCRGGSHAPSQKTPRGR